MPDTTLRVLSDTNCATATQILINAHDELVKLERAAVLGRKHGQPIHSVRVIASQSATTKATFRFCVEPEEKEETVRRDADVRA